MNHRSLILTLTLMLFGTVGAMQSAAQSAGDPALDLTQTVCVAPITIGYPTGWHSFDDSNGQHWIASTDQAARWVLNPVSHGSLGADDVILQIGSGSSTSTDPAAALTNLIQHAAPNDQFAPMETVQIGSYPAARVTFTVTDQQIEGVGYMILVSGQAVNLTALMGAGQTASWQPTLDAIAASIAPSPSCPQPQATAEATIVLGEADGGGAQYSVPALDLPQTFCYTPITINYPYGWTVSPDFIAVNWFVSNAHAGSQLAMLQSPNGTTDQLQLNSGDVLIRLFVQLSPSTDAYEMLTQILNQPHPGFTFDGIIMWSQFNGNNTAQAFMGGSTFDGSYSVLDFNGEEIVLTALFPKDEFAQWQPTVNAMIASLAMSPEACD